MDQRTDEWFAARLGKVTASRVADVIAKTKTGPSASRENYATQLVLERLTNKQAESYTNSAMQWGTETEPMARQAYELKRGLFVNETGFVDHPTIEMCGASPDGLVGADGLIEIKCPNSATHMETILTQKVPPEICITKRCRKVRCRCCRHRSKITSPPPTASRRSPARRVG